MGFTESEGVLVLEKQGRVAQRSGKLRITITIAEILF
jgi:hypothetical protein